MESIKRSLSCMEVYGLGNRSFLYLSPTVVLILWESGTLRKSMPNQVGNQNAFHRRLVY
jgi:hypothetical protein